MFEGAEYTSSFCHAKDQAGEWGGGLARGNKGTVERMYGVFAVNFVCSCSLDLFTGVFYLAVKLLFGVCATFTSMQHTYGGINDHFGH